MTPKSTESPEHTPLPQLNLLKLSPNFILFQVYETDLLCNVYIVFHFAIKLSSIDFTNSNFNKSILLLQKNIQNTTHNNQLLSEIPRRQQG